MLKKVFLAALPVLLFSVQVFSADDALKLPEKGSFAVSYDEGLACRYFILDNVAAYLSAAYYVLGPDTIGIQPLQATGIKIGGEYVFRTFEKMRVTAFGEFREEVNQKEIKSTLYPSFYRWSQWNTVLRFGIRPELFINEHLSIDYKLGLQIVFHGTDYKLNTSGNGLVEKKNTYTEFGVYEARFPTVDGGGQDHNSGSFFQKSLLLNIGFNIYITKFNLF